MGGNNGVKATDRILELLFASINDDDGYIAPFCTCQYGMSETLSVARGTVTNSLHELIDAGLVSIKRVSYVREGSGPYRTMKTKQQVYSLTEEGIEYMRNKQ